MFSAALTVCLTPSGDWKNTVLAYLTSAPLPPPFYRYEPYILIDRFQAPWHDARFRGYGSDKVSYINSVNTAKFHFKVHPDGWVIHRWVDRVYCRPKFILVHARTPPPPRRTLQV